MKLSIVSTLYQSELYVNEFVGRSKLVANEIAGEDYEIILVNDGSPDKSLKLAVQLTEQISNLVVIDLSRNFGHHKAMMTGLMHAQGDLVFLIDSDLEEEPEWLISFYNQLNKVKCDVVYGVQMKRKGNWLERCSGNWFYRFFRFFTGLSLPENVVTARLMTSSYVQALTTHKEREVFLAGLWYITGFDQQPFRVLKYSTSETTYTFRRKLSLLINSITSFSNAPLKGIFYIGVLISVFALLYTTYLVGFWLILEKPVAGWTSVMASIWLLSGLIISFIGVVGIYLSKIFSETKQRPYSIVRRIYAKSQ